MVREAVKYLLLLLLVGCAFHTGDREEESGRKGGLFKCDCTTRCEKIESPPPHEFTACSISKKKVIEDATKHGPEIGCDITCLCLDYETACVIDNTTE